MRKEWKTKAKARVKKCYGLFLVLCILLSLTGLDYTSSLQLFKDSASTSDTMSSKMLTVATDLMVGDTEAGEEDSDEAYASREQQSNWFGPISIDHSEGVLAQLTNNVSSGRIFVSLYDLLQTISIPSWSQASSLSFWRHFSCSWSGFLHLICCMW